MIATLWIPRRIYTSFWDATKQARTYDVLRKDCNLDTKDVYIPHSSFVFYHTTIAVSGPAKITFKVTLHGKPYFLFPEVLKRWSFQKNCAGIWSFLYYRERWYFFFLKIWSYTLDGKWKMIFLKKYTEIYFLQAFWKYGLSKRCRAGTWSFLYYLERWYFFPENMIFFPWAESERRPFSGNTWKHDASPSEKDRKPDI